MACIERGQGEEKLISVIIPVYNTEKYLSACIESVIQQTYRNLEIILVDDGSSDRSGEICDEFQKIDSRIQVIHKENGGPTSARKAGTSKATGRYIGFVDSDDWIDKDMYQIMLRAMLAESADLVATGIIYENVNYAEAVFDAIGAGVYRKERLDELRSKMLYGNKFTPQGIIWALYTKLFKREYLWPLLKEESDMLRHGEDVACSCAYICGANCVVVLGQAFYHYRQHDGSIVHSKNHNYLENLNLLHNYFRNLAKKGNYPLDIVSKFDCFVFDLCLQMPKYMFDDPREVPMYSFPFDRIPMNSRLVLYGAGKVGKSYFNLIQWTNAFRVVGWIDQNYKELRMENISWTDILRSIVYDYIIIAVKSENTAQKIKNSLVDLNVPESKIFWFEPKHLFDVMFQ